MADTNTERRGGQDFQRPGSIRQHVAAMEHNGSAELRIVPRAATKKLVMASRGERQFINQKMSVTCQCIGKNQGGAMDARLCDTTKIRHDLAGGSFRVFGQIMTDCPLKPDLSALYRQSRDRPLARRKMGELASRRGTNHHPRRALFCKSPQQISMCVLRCGKDDERIGQP